MANSVSPPVSGTSRATSSVAIGGSSQIGRVGVPHAAEVDRLVLELGDVDDLRETLDALDERIFDRRAEAARQRQEALGRQVLVAEEDHQVIEQRLTDRRRSWHRAGPRPGPRREVRRRAHRRSGWTSKGALRMSILPTLVVAGRFLIRDDRWHCNRPPFSRGLATGDVETGSDRNDRRRTSSFSPRSFSTPRHAAFLADEHLCPGDRSHARAFSAQQPEPPQGAVRAARSSACADVRLRPDGLRPGASSAMRAPMVVFDVLARLLRLLYPRVTYVRNITDVDDKINARAKESGEPIAAITARTTADFHADMAALGVLPPDEEPRATQHIAQMIDDHRAADRRRPRLCGGRARAVLGAEFPGVWTSVGTQPGRAAGRRTDRRGAVQARSRRLRAVEAVDARSAGMGQPVGPRPARLAHRVQRDVVALSRRDVRHPRRRHRPDLSAP